MDVETAAGATDWAEVVSVYWSVVVQRCSTASKCTLSARMAHGRVFLAGANACLAGVYDWIRIENVKASARRLP